MHQNIIHETPKRKNSTECHDARLAWLCFATVFRAYLFSSGPSKYLVYSTECRTELITIDFFSFFHFAPSVCRVNWHGRRATDCCTKYIVGPFRLDFARGVWF